MSSTDGWCSLISFKPTDLGKVYTPETESSKENENSSANNTEKSPAGKSSAEKKEKIPSETPTIDVKKAPKISAEPMAVDSSA